MATAIELTVMEFLSVLGKQIHIPTNNMNAVAEYFCILGTSEQVKMLGACEVKICLHVLCFSFLLLRCFLFLN